MKLRHQRKRTQVTMRRVSRFNSLIAPGLHLCNAWRNRPVVEIEDFPTTSGHFSFNCKGEYRWVPGGPWVNFASMVTP